MSRSSNEEYHLTCQGVHEVVVNTWRPSGFRVLDKLKRFFVGGAPQIDDISYVTQPTDFQVGMEQKGKLFDGNCQYCQTLSDLFCVFREHTWADMDLGLSHLEVWSCVSTLLIRAGNGTLGINISSCLWYVGHRRWDIIKPFFLLQSHNGEITNTRFFPLTKVS